MLSEEIREFFSGEILDDERTLRKYSYDYSIFSVRPKTVVFPRNVDDLKKLVKFAAKSKKIGKNNISLTPRSAGTDMTGGPLGESIIVDFTKHFNRVREINKEYAVVEPGVYFRDFEKALFLRNLLYPPYPASKDLCALGGMISNNSGGEKSLAYGKTEDYVLELKVVMSDGEEHVIKPISKNELLSKTRKKDFEGRFYKKIHGLIDENYDLIKSAKPKVSKNSAGYFLWNVWDKEKNIFDLTKLFVGSQGTLGLITEAKLKVVKIKKYSRMAVVFMNDIGMLADLIVEILKFRPESLESYDDKTLNVALRFLTGIIKSMKGSFLKLILDFLPEAVMVLRGGLPKMVIIAVFTSDDKAELEGKIELFRSDMKKFKVQTRLIKDESEAQKYWAIRRQSFKLLHDYTSGMDTAPFIDDIIVNPEHLPEFLPKLNAILDNYRSDLIYTVAGHPGNGNFHVIPLMDLKNARIRELIPRISDEVYDLVLQYGGSITAEHNDGLIRTPYLEKMYGKKITSLFSEVKTIFDPQNIFNPRKKIGADLKYSLSHIGTKRNGESAYNKKDDATG
ncbi:MAG: FAD-binding oxidoreductase [Patescibacteria group bacterium]